MKQASKVYAKSMIQNNGGEEKKDDNGTQNKDNVGKGGSRDEWKVQIRNIESSQVDQGDKDEQLRDTSLSQDFEANADQYEDVIAKFPYRDKLMIHTSGSFESKKFEKITKRWGCLYPLQTISKTKEVNWKNVQFFTECAQENDYLKMSTLCKKAGFISQYANSEKRKQLHIAAVVSNNFTYHLLSLVKTHCLKNNIDYNQLRHLIEQSIENVTQENPFVLQTGPAVRNDTKLIERQLSMLKNEHELKEIYDLFTRQIIQKHHHEL